MAVSTNLEFPLLSVGQTDKETWMNVAINGMADALSRLYTVDASTITGAGQSITLPYSSTNDLSDRTALRFMQLSLTGTPSNDFNVIHPAKAHMFIVTNSSGKTATVKTPSGTGIAVSTGFSQLLYCDGTNVVTIDLQALTPLHYDFGTPRFVGQPTASEIIAEIPIVRDIVIPVNFAGAVGYTLTANPTASFAIDVQDDGTSFGTITIDTSGVYTFVTTGGTTHVVAAGSLIRLVAPATVDATIDGILVGFKATEN